MTSLVHLLVFQAFWTQGKHSINVSKPHVRVVMLVCTFEECKNIKLYQYDCFFDFLKMCGIKNDTETKKKSHVALALSFRSLMYEMYEFFIHFYVWKWTSPQLICPKLNSRSSTQPQNYLYSLFLHLLILEQLWSLFLSHPTLVSPEIPLALPLVHMRNLTVSPQPPALFELSAPRQDSCNGLLIHLLALPVHLHLFTTQQSKWSFRVECFFPLLKTCRSLWFTS